MKRYFMGIDSGTSGIKAIVMDDTGRVLGSGYRECDLITPRPNWVEQDPLDWWRACSFAAKKAAKESGIGREIAAIGFSGQMQGCTLMDKGMKPLANCMIWMDQRASAEAEELNSRLLPSEFLQITASYCLPSYWASKLLWMQRNTPEVYSRIYKVLFTKDFLRYMMTGELATEVSDASCTWLIDLRKRNWSDKMFSVCGISRDIVPERMLESQDVAGYLKPDIASDWGMQAGIPVVAGGGDQTAGGIGCGVIRPGVLAATIGTSGVVFGCCEEPFVDPEKHGMYSLCHSVPGMYSFLGCTLGAGGSFKWMRDTLFADKKASMALEKKDVYDYMTSLAATAKPGCEGVCFLPYLAGEGTPVVDPNARGVFFGLSYRSGLETLCRSVMEGVTFSLRDTIEILRNANGFKVAQVRAMGGGARSQLWRQIQADVYNATVLTMNIEEGPAAGAAIMAAVGAGHFKNIGQGCDAILRVSTVTEPIAKNVDMYNDYYATYHALYGDLKKRFASQAVTVAKYLV